MPVKWHTAAAPHDRPSNFSKSMQLAVRFTLESQRLTERLNARYVSSTRLKTDELARDYLTHEVGAGTSHGPSTSMLLKSAGPTTSRYSMSSE